MDFLSVIKSIAPTVASALGGPLAGAAVGAIGSILGQDSPSIESIAGAIQDGKLTADHIAEIRKLELQYRNDEQERGFKYAELAFKDRDSARNANVASGTQTKLFTLSILLLFLTLGTEVAILFNGTPKDIDPVIVGRILGLLDAVSMMVLSYWYGTSSGSAQKTELLASAPAVK